MALWRIAVRIIKLLPGVLIKELVPHVRIWKNLPGVRIKDFV